MMIQSDRSDRETEKIRKMRQTKKHEPVVPEIMQSSDQSSGDRTAKSKLLTENIPASSQDQRCLEYDKGYNGKYRHVTDSWGTWVVENDQELNMNRERAGLNPYSPRSLRAVAKDVRFSTTPSSDKCLLNYPLTYYHAKRDQELLRKVDELHDQIYKSYGLSYELKEGAPMSVLKKNESSPLPVAKKEIGGLSYELKEGAPVSVLKKNETFPLPVAKKETGGLTYPKGCGAPFITCPNCFTLLQLPRKLVLREKNNKLKCGACSMIIQFFIENKRLVSSSFTPIVEIVSNSCPSLEGVDKNISHSRNDVIGGTSYSDDAHFVFTDTEPGLSSMETCHETHIHLSFPSSSDSEDLEISKRVISRREVLDSVELPSKVNMSSAVPQSPLHDKSSHLVSKPKKGNRIRHINQEEEVVLNKATSTHKSMKGASMETGLDFSNDEISYVGVSHISRDVTREEDLPKISKGSNPFFVDLIKKSFRELSKSRQMKSEKSNVLASEQPIPERMTKKAEKQTGPIHLGQS
ncbi:hypothetical protein GIB67_014459 [Kingdonia uniflora]|uniref:Probable zinc-ribbon domain-containing protein n=1 Tax=Kingdonia uniflora TaxID=39325 RepID=A0A7J7LZ43_9MAGN|nr:hypothetical protein GIB67_014459 [Kingdonia uniflora]